MFPKVCVLCDAVGEELCGDCHGLLPVIPAHHCTVCGIPFVAKVTAHECGICLKDRPLYDKHRSLFQFKRGARELIHLFKYESRFWVRGFVEKYYQELAPQFSDSNVIVPIPLHANKLKQRGYNQSLMLAEVWGAVLGISILPQGLYRVVDSKSQTGLNKSERQKNLVEAFQINPDFDWTEKSVLLVDDVRTTGATIEVATKVLLAAGAKKVQVSTVAMVD